MPITVETDEVLGEIIVCREVYQRGEAGFLGPLPFEHDAVTLAYGKVMLVNCEPSNHSNNQYTHTSRWRKL